MLEDIQKLFSLGTAEKNLYLDCSAETDLPELLLDEIRLRQTLVNLVGNAVKFTSSGGIRISLRTDPGEADQVLLTITVEDTGIGIPEADQELIFEAFRQRDGKRDRRHGGTGLGLTITRRLVHLMGGNIDLQSTPGEGSRFTITLSAQLAAPGVSQASPPTNLEGIDFDPATVLVVDDDDLNRLLICHYLQNQPLQLIEAIHGEQALEQCARTRPDLILLDMQMPVMDGYATSERLRADPALRDVPRIALTASVLSHELPRIYESCHGYLAKPLSRVALLNAMARFLPYSSNDQTKPVDTP